jgi:tRNA nucleotidyltransferase/poly(A) polymerase
MEIIYPSTPHWNFARSVVQNLRDKGYESYLVGGCVRDIVLGVVPGDYDIASSAKPDEVLGIYPTANKSGIRYGVLQVSEGSFYVQIATFREDHPQSDGRRPQEVYFSTLEEDAKRRDFTINAMYLNPLNGELYDPFNGHKDLQDKVLRFVGVPEIRIIEDHLRILRAVRFASRFDLRIEEESWNALYRYSHLVEKVSPNRAQDEITRSFCEGNKVYSFEMLHLLNILTIFWDIFKTAPSVVEKCKNNLKNCKENSPEANWAAFYEAFTIVENWRELVTESMIKFNFPKKTRKAVLDIIETPVKESICQNIVKESS